LPQLAAALNTHDVRGGAPDGVGEHEVLAGRSGLRADRGPNVLEPAPALNYRLYFGGQFLSQIGTWLQSDAMSYAGRS
jgi:hypothetical protein